MNDDELLDALADALRVPERELTDDRVADLRRLAEARGLVAGEPTRPDPIVPGLRPAPQEPAGLPAPAAAPATSDASEPATSSDEVGTRRARRQAADEERRRSRRALLRGGAAAGIGVVAGAAGVLGLGVGDDGAADDGPPTQPVAFAAGPDGVTVAGRTIDHTWGMELLLDVAGLPDGAEYEVRYATDAGPVSAGGFRAVAAVTMHCRFNATALRSAVSAVDVVDTATGTPVLRGTIA